MSSKIAQTIGRKLLQGEASKHEGQDPHYEEYRDSRGRIKQRKRPLPEGLSKRDAKILKKIRRRAHYLDKGFSICGFRFGWTAIIGLIPLAGEVVDAGLSWYLIIKPSQKADIPGNLTQRMMFNTAVGTAMGVVPIAGDIMLAVWKGNSRNAALLEEFLVARVAKEQKAAANPVQNAAAGSSSTGAENGGENALAKGVVKDSKKKGWFSKKTGETKASEQQEAVRVEEAEGGKVK